MTDPIALARPDLLRRSAYIDGQWADGDATLTVSNPATGAVIGTVPNLGGTETSGAVTAAERALPGWRARSAKERSDILRRWHDLIIAHREDLARILTSEQGKPLAEAHGEVGSTAAYFEWFAEEARRIYGEVIPANQADRRLIVTRAPVGVVAAVTPWNFPSSMIARKVAPALAAGCTIVLKPSDLTPFSALALAVLAEEAGVPAGVFNIVTGAPAPIGDVLVGDPRVAKFSFTGSTAVGKQLAARCMATVKRVSLELGGNAPFIVFADADLDAAVAGAMIAKFRNAGQTCICANRIFVEAPVYDAFAARLAERAAALRLGDGLAEGTDQGPLIDTTAVDKVARHLKDAIERGARMLTGGGTAEGSFFAPTVLADVDPQSLLCREETFGPLAALIRFEGEAEALALANEGRAGLAAYVYTRDMARSYRMAEALEYGMVGMNTGIVSTEVAPFGGIRESGLGREGGRHGIDDYVEIKLTAVGVPPLAEGA
ncbi:NAD-dependent succinate-semialdehyde dehydrogenase [Sphingomonas sp. DT-204]|uniref:NAD-dependent succinate-semialdehyde dehydrogenase n=1 Tax=Sphingomonas sp. DT-204 TaxID=3396166 RepID=UPI003F1CC154